MSPGYPAVSLHKYLGLLSGPLRIHARGLLEDEDIERLEAAGLLSPDGVTLELDPHALFEVSRAC